MRFSSKLLVFAIACGASGPAFANTGVPLLSFPVAWTMLLLVPIIGAETYVLRKRLRFPIVRTTLVMIGANLLSTLAGFVIAIASAFLPLMAQESTITDLVTLVLLAPFFWLSVKIEAPFAAAMLKGFDGAAVWKTVREANLYSYFMLAVFLVTKIIKNAIVFGKFFAP